ncbi:MAG: autotransporter assembly complex protein TamA [Alphaproteobacteria bacterium]|nr:autotransporter assembly complex protein TamA [Alphaproteobacteria bacterium]
MNDRRNSAIRLAKAAALGATVSVLLSVSPASAFKLFGVHLWGEKETEQVTEEVPDPVRYDVTLTTNDPELKESLDSISLLVSEKDKPVSGTIGLLSKARNDKRRLVAALYAKALYGGTVAILINGRPFETVPIDAVLNRGGQANVSIHVIAGPVFTFSQPDAATTSGQAIDLADYGVVAGELASSERVVEAGRKLVSAWRDDGYPFATISQSTLTADHDTDTLEVRIRLDSGASAVFGTVTVVGAEDVDPQFIIRQADIQRGARFSPQVLADAGTRLRALGVFDSVIIEEADQLAADGSLPITITVSERKSKTFGVGVTAATTDGLGFEGFWTHRNLFGHAESFRIEGGVTGIGRSNFSTGLDYHIAATFKKPGVWGPMTSFRSTAEIQLQNTEAFQKQSVGGSVGFEHEFSKTTTGEIDLKYEYARFDETVGPSVASIISLPTQIVRDTRDNKLNPTSGYRVLLYGEPSYDLNNSNAFFKTRAAFSTYRAVNEARTVVLAGRVAAGTIVGSDLADIPADRRFYAGGGGSIRGYNYQVAGPRSGGQPTGGLSFAEASAEVRFSVTDTIGLAAFVDSGGAFASAIPGENGTWYTGVGAGVRYLTPVGPLRLDVAVPLNKISGEPGFGFYLGLGQAF